MMERNERNQAAVAARAAARERGMTLIEIMIVLAIIALVMGLLVGPAVIQRFKEARIQTAWMMTKEYEAAYAKWMTDHEGDCPDKLEDLSRYMNKKDLKDPWGSIFVMKCGEAAPDQADTGFGVLSFGPDKREGTKDDIHSWDAKPKK